MKLVIAYIRPDRLDPVTQCLTDAGFSRMSVTHAMGCGSQVGYSESYRGATKSIRLLNTTRLEIAVRDEAEQRCVTAIVEGARTGSHGDGKIFVVALDRVVRIGTGEQGDEALD